MSAVWKIASWNVNSINVRETQILDWILTLGIDLIALQETKVIDDKFPMQAFLDQGFHLAFSGQKSYNGVALISRHPLTDIYTEPSEVSQRRIIAASLGELRIVNVYVPNGSEPYSEKYHYKLAWLAELKQFLQKQIQLYPKLLVMGDFNIAPEDIDVHDPVLWRNSVLVSPPEREALKEILALGFMDSFRSLNPELQTYSWWDYRAAGFRRNHGLRIDLILLSQALAACCSKAKIDAGPREHPRPSDHAPIWVELQIN